MIKKILLVMVGLIQMFNGAYMLLHSQAWFNNAAADTGPYNAHFVHDVGATFVVVGFSLWACVWRSQYWPAAIAGAGFLCAHGLIHIVGLFDGHAHHALRDSIAIVLPACLALWAAWPSDKVVAHA